MSELENFAKRYRVDLDHVRRWVIEAMVLGALADGEFDERESQEILRTIAANDAFEGMDSTELRTHLENSFEGIRRDGFEPRLHALAGALPGYPHRLLAFRSAVSVALADGKIAHDEVDFLRKMQALLEIEETDVALAFDDAQGGTIDQASATVEPVEAYLDCLLMAAAADRSLRDEELATIIAFILSRDEFSGIHGDELRDRIHGRLRTFADGGIQQRLASLPGELTTLIERENAYGLAIAITVADGELVAEEKVFLAQLRRALWLDEDANPGDSVVLEEQ